MRSGAKELQYEIRGIVKKAHQVQELGQQVYWENIGDPVQKGCRVPPWMREILVDLVQKDDTYSYCHSKGVPETRDFLAAKTNALGGARIDSDDILFFNGLGDAISKIYQYILPTSRVIGPSPAYSTHSSAEAAHANDHPLTYRLDPKDNWYPDVDDLYLKIKYNPSIVGILIINPDNPTGMVYPLETLKRIVEIAREFDLFLVSDEIYLNIVYNGARSYSLAEIINDVPGIALKGISKEFPWPGARCGWAEFYNRKQDESFDRLCTTLEDSKMIEVCSTKLPQLAIPRIMGHQEYEDFRTGLNIQIGKRSDTIAEILAGIDEIYFNRTYGAFYNSIIFRDEALNHQQSLSISNPTIADLVKEWVCSENGAIGLDTRFAYYLLGATGVCVVPVSSFCSELYGFRVTLLEEDDAALVTTFGLIRDGISEFLGSS